jgi:two-component system chemotaxis response regulator CheB
MGGSAGSLAALSVVLGSLPSEFPAPIVIALHQHEDNHGRLCSVLSQLSVPPVKEAEDKELIDAGWVYLAPADYHLLIESEGYFALSLDDKVCFARPAIDVLFEAAADAFGSHLLGILLSGANRDGTAGMRRIKARGGTTVAQDPATAKVPLMPRSAIDAGAADHVVAIEDIGPFAMRWMAEEVD